MSQTVESKALSKIPKHGEGRAFTKTDFDEASFHQALSSLSKTGTIRRVCQGVCGYPRYGNIPGRRVGPDIHRVARAPTRKFNWRIQPNGDTDLNFLRLCTQAPVRVVYLSDGPSRKYAIGNPDFQKSRFEGCRLQIQGKRRRWRRWGRGMSNRIRPHS